MSSVALLALLLAVVCFVPLLGYLGATAFARAAIVEPQSCISPLALRLRVKAAAVGAPCVEVRNPETGEVVAGRLILARGDRVFLYSKEEDRAWVLHVADASISSGARPRSAGAAH